jgi:DNA gyrase/topoisomerase IV subunit A
MKSSDFVSRIARDYSIYVATNRAIPSVSDGLKHSQRVALYLASSVEKTVSLSGKMSGSGLYIHGDQSANNAIGLLCAPYVCNIPLLKGYGQHGSKVSPQAIGAPRYTSVSRSPSAEKFLYNDSDIIPMQPNYDGSCEEPSHFLPLIPLVLLNGIEGIAVGWSCSILRRSFRGLIDATMDALDEKPIISGIDLYYEHFDVGISKIGANQYEFTGKIKIEDANSIRILDLPPNLSIENVRKKLIELEDEDLIHTFVDSSTDKIDILVRFKRGSIKGWTKDQAIDFLKLRQKVTERIVVLNWDGKSIRTFDNASDLVREFTTWRFGWYVKRYEKLLKDAQTEQNYWNIIKALFDHSFPKKLGTFKNKSEMETEIESICNKVTIIPEAGQIEKVVGLPTYRWTKDFEQEVIAKIASLIPIIADYKDMIQSPDKLKAVYRGELEALKKIKT